MSAYSRWRIDWDAMNGQFTELFERVDRWRDQAQSDERRAALTAIVREAEELVKQSDRLEQEAPEPPLPSLVWWSVRDFFQWSPAAPVLIGAGIWAAMVMAIWLVML